MTKIQEFNELFSSKEILFLGNDWDLLSALMLEKAGFKAIGTTSWGIANWLGYADGEFIGYAGGLSGKEWFLQHERSFKKDIT